MCVTRVPGDIFRVSYDPIALEAVIEMTGNPRLISAVLCQGGSFADAGSGAEDGSCVSPDFSGTVVWATLVKGQ
jgi:hypothetical protein